MKRAALSLATLAPVGAANAASNSVEMKIPGGELCISSNGTPAHSIGKFPNRGNPNAFKMQILRVA